MNPESPFVMIEAWNEWGEGANIEPAKEHGFGYLREIAGARGLDIPAKPRVPTEAEIASWSILNEEELRVAAAREEMPWPVQETYWNRRGESREAAAVEMPFVIDRTTGDDASLTLPPLEVSMNQIRRVVIEAEPVEVSSSFHFELFWTTALGRIIPGIDLNGQKG